MAAAGSKPVYIITLPKNSLSKNDKAQIEKKLGVVVWLEYDPSIQTRPEVQVF